MLKNIFPGVAGKASPLFLKKGEGCGERGKTSFPVKRSFSPFPASHFTLIELLVVIAIISILASLLLPVLKDAQERGSAAVCTNNLRQIGQAVQSYVNETDGWYYHGYGGMYDRNYYPQSIYNKIARYCGGPDYSQIVKSINARKYDFGAVPKIFFCPDQEFPLGTNHQFATNLAYGMAYKLNGNGNKDWGFGMPIFKSGVFNKLPLGMYTLSGDVYSQYHTENGASSTDSRLNTWLYYEASEVYGVPYLRHNNRANLLFFTGNVKNLSYAEIINNPKVRTAANGDKRMFSGVWSARKVLMK